MSLLGKIGIFILFIFVYLYSMKLRGVLVGKLMHDSFRGKLYLNTELLLLLFLTPLFLFIYLLSGFFSLSLVLLFFVCSQLSLLISITLSALLLDKSSAEVGQRVFLGGVELGFTNQSLRNFDKALRVIQSIIIFFVYPTVAGIIYFALPQAELPLRIFQCTLVLFIFGSFPVGIFSNISIMTSRTIDEEARTALFVEGVGSLIQISLYLALTFWAFGVAKRGVGFEIGGVSMVVSLQLIISLFSFFILATIVPYLVGVQRAKKWRLKFLVKQRGWLAKLTTILDVPSSQRYLPKLTQLKEELASEAESLRSDNSVILSEHIQQGLFKGNLPETVDIHSIYLENSPSLAYKNWLGEFSDEVEEVVVDLTARDANAEKERAAEVWAEHYNERKDEQDEEIKKAKEAKPPIWVVASVVLLPLISAVLGKAAEWLWTTFQTASQK